MTYSVLLDGIMLDGLMVSLFLNTEQNIEAGRFVAGICVGCFTAILV
jgi:hypothetical protein